MLSPATNKMNEQMDELTNGRTNKRMNERTNERTNELINDWLNDLKQMNKQTNKRTFHSAVTNEWTTNEQTNVSLRNHELITQSWFNACLENSTRKISRACHWGTSINDRALPAWNIIYIVIRNCDNILLLTVTHLVVLLEELWFQSWLAWRYYHFAIKNSSQSDQDDTS